MIAGGEGGVKIFISFIHLGLATISIFDLPLYSSNKQTLQSRSSTDQARLEPVHFYKTLIMPLYSVN